MNVLKRFGYGLAFPFVVLYAIAEPVVMAVWEMCTEFPFVMRWMENYAMVKEYLREKVLGKPAN